MRAAPCSGQPGKAAVWRPHPTARKSASLSYPVPGLVPGIHVFLATVRDAFKSWMTGTSPVKGRFFRWQFGANSAVSCPAQPKLDSYGTAPSESGSEIDLQALVHVGLDVAEGRRLHDVELELEDARRVLVLVGPFEPDRHRRALKLLQILDRQAVDLGAGLLELAPGLHVRLLDRGVMDPAIDLDLVLQPLLDLGRQLVPVVHADAEIHQIDRLIDRFEPARPHPDVLCDLLEAEIPVDRRAGVVGRLDRTLFERREDFAAWQQGGLGADCRKPFGDHAAGNAQFQIPEILDRADRLFRMDDRSEEHTS